MVEPHTMLAARYRLGEVIARGGMGVVLRGEDERLGRPVAVKTVRTADPDLVQRIRREAVHLARLSHPNIVRLYDVVEHDGQPHLITQFVEGRPLRELLGALPPARVAWAGEEVASALAAAHQLGIVHRDLKPSNILVGEDSLHLLDFGIARHVDDTTMTAAGSLIGTASYISPEQLRGQAALPAADVYALGLVLIECLTGEAAFPGTFAETVAARVVHAPDLDAVPESWRDLLGRMTTVEPTARPSAAEVATDLRHLRRCGLAAMPAPAAAAAAAATPRALAFAEPPASSARRHRPRRTAASHGRRTRAVVPMAVAAGFLGVVGAATAVTGGAPEPAASTEIAAAAPATTAVVIPPTTVPTTTTTTVAPPTTAPPTTASTAAPAVVPVAAPPTTVGPETLRQLEQLRQLQQLKQAKDLEALQDDWEKRLEEQAKKLSRRGRSPGRDRD